MDEDGICVEGDIDRMGEAPAFVLLHSLAMDRTMWDPVVAALPPAAAVVRCDLPGHGSSCSVAETSVEEMADRVAEYLESTPFDSFIVAGLSLGGCVAQALAARHASLVAALCLVDTTAWYGEDAEERWEARAQQAQNDGFDSLAEFQLARWFTPAFNERQPEIGRQLLDIFRANDVTSYVATCRAMGRFDARPVLGTIRVPTTVIVGELDPATPPAHAELLARSIPGATLRVLKDTSHMSAVQRPEAVVTALTDLRADLADPA